MPEDDNEKYATNFKKREKSRDEYKVKDSNSKDEKRPTNESKMTN